MINWFIDLGRNAGIGRFFRDIGPWGTLAIGIVGGIILLSFIVTVYTILFRLDSDSLAKWISIGVCTVVFILGAVLYVELFKVAFETLRDYAIIYPDLPEMTFGR